MRISICQISVIRLYLLRPKASLNYGVRTSPCFSGCARLFWVGLIISLSTLWDQMKMCREIREKGIHGPEETKIWMICATYAFFLTSAFVVILVLDSADWRTSTLVNNWGQRLRPASKATRPPNWHNILIQDSSNYTTTLSSLLLLNTGESAPCLTASTNTTKLEGLPDSINGTHSFSADELHHLTLVTFDGDGQQRCAGGDYYEVDFHDRDNLYYRSRLPTTDFGNGSYGLELTVPSRFAGSFTLDIFLLYSNWHGLELDPSSWAKKHLMLSQDLDVIVLSEQGDESFTRKPVTLNAHELKQCTPADFDRTTWQGRWTRTWYNSTCNPEEATKRFRCIPEEHFACEEPWCFGPMGRLDSNGWHYSAHCGFKIFEREDAWKCLDGRWFMMWGDSNFQDTIRNLLLFVLEWQLPSSKKLAEFQLPRTYEMAFTNSHSYDQLFRVSQLYNGAHYENGNGEGLKTLQNEEHQDRLRAHFNGTTWPDTVIMNSGLHDGYSSLQAYTEAADFTVGFWVAVYQSLPADRRPQMVWRTTVAPAGIGRDMPSNPNKMEMYNHIMAEKLQAVSEQMPVKFIDTFDLTFPFHYNNEFSDGGHYGRAPGVDLWPWFKKPHWYFVDVMLAHIFLNALCPST